MPLPTVLDLREYLRIETTVEDNLLGRLLAQARAAVEAYIRQPIEARPVTLPLVLDRGGTLTFPIAPIAAPILVSSPNGAEVPSADYSVVNAGGRITLKATHLGFGAYGYGGSSGYFGEAGMSEYTVSATAGLSLRDDYAVLIEPALSAAIIDWAADLYQRRNPAASYESGGGGVAVNYNETASKTMPSRIRVTLDPWRRVLV